MLNQLTIYQAQQQHQLKKQEKNILEKMSENFEKKISSMAMEIAEKVIGRALDEKDRSKLVDEFIEELGEEA